MLACNVVATGSAEMALRAGAAPLFLAVRWIEDALGTSTRPGVPRGATTDLGVATRTAGVLAKVALDELFLLSELLTSSVIGVADRDRLGRELGDGLALARSRGWLSNPASYHETPAAPADVHRRGDTALMTEFVELRYASGYEPHAGEPGRQRWLDQVENRTAYARIFEHPGPARPWLVCVPGYRMGSAPVDLTGFRVRWLYHELGLNVAIPIMPLHGPRAAPGSRGGDGFMRGDFVDTLHAQTQAVWDVRRLIAHLRTHRAERIGMYGVSLGGYTAALVASFESDLDCVVAGIPAVDWVALARTHTPSAAASLTGLSGALERVEELLRVVSPLVLQPAVARERRYLFAGLSDRLAPADHARRLWEHWQRPHALWFEGSHVSFFWEQKVRELLATALGQSGLVRGGADNPA